MKCMRPAGQPGTYRLLFYPSKFVNEYYVQTIRNNSRTLIVARRIVLGPAEVMVGTSHYCKPV
jgi:hypothetical protein